MNDDKSFSLTDVEWRIMRSLWKLGEPTLGQVLKDVADIGWTKHAVISFLKRLTSKGIVNIDSSQRPSRYSARVDQSVALRSEAQSALHTVYGNDLMLMMTNAVSAGELSEDETQALIDILKKGG